MMITNRQGMAIPLVLLFVIIAFIFLFSMVYSRTEVRKQTFSNQMQKKAYYLAQAGIQHALLKLRLLPREAYKAGAILRGVCPFYTLYGSKLVAQSGNCKSRKAIEIYKSDIMSASAPFHPDALKWEIPIPENPNFPWKYEISSFTVYTYYTSTDTSDLGSIREVAFIETTGFAYDPREKETQRKEIVTKIVELKRKIK